MSELLRLWNILCAPPVFEFLPVAEQDAGIALVLEDVFHAGVRPEEASDAPHVLAVELNLQLRGRPAALCVQRAGDGHEPHAAEVHLVDGPDRLGGLGHHLDLAGVPVLPVAEGRDDDQSFLLLLPVPGADLVADVAGVVVVHQPTDADDQVVALVEGVEVFCGGEDADVSFPQIVDEQCGLRFVPPQPRQVLDHDRVQSPALSRLGQAAESRPGEGHATDVVVKGLAYDSESTVHRELPADGPLVLQGVPLRVVVVRQPVVQPRPRCRHCCLLSRSPPSGSRPTDPNHSPANPKPL